MVPFVPGALAVADGVVWVLDAYRGVLVRLEGAAPVMTGAFPTVGARYRGRSADDLLVAGGVAWVADVAGVVGVNCADGAAVARFDLGSRPVHMAAGEGALWVVPYAQERVARIDLATLTVAWVWVGPGPLFAVPYEDGTWIGREADDRVLFVTPDGVAASRSLVIDGLLDTAVLAAGRLLVWSRLLRGWPVRSLVTVFDPANGEMLDVVPTGSAPASHPIVGVGDVWLLVDAGEAVERVDPSSGAVTARLDASVAHIREENPETGTTRYGRDGTLRDLVVEGDTGWAIRHGYRTPAALVRIDLAGSGRQTPVPVDLDVASFDPPSPRPPYRRWGWPEVPEARPVTVEEYETRMIASLDAALREPGSLSSGRTGRRLARRGFGHDDVDYQGARLAGTYPQTRVQVLFTTTELPGVRLGWETRLWDGAGTAIWRSEKDDCGGLPMPVPSGAEIYMEVEEDTVGAHWGPPDVADPDGEGITWMLDPYSGIEGDFADEMERARRAFVVSDRPFLPAEIARLTAHGVDSIDALEAFVAARIADPGAHPACWLLAELGGIEVAERFTPLMRHHLDPAVRVEAARIVSRITHRTGSQVGVAGLLEALINESATEVGVVLLEAATRVGEHENRYRLALRVLADATETSEVRQAAAAAAGRLSFGRLEAVAALRSALVGPDIELAVTSAEALAWATRRSPAILAPFVDDERVTTNGDTLGQRAGRALADHAAWLIEGGHETVAAPPALGITPA